MRKAVPNLLTLGVLVLGFVGVEETLRGNWDGSLRALLLAAALDMGAGWLALRWKGRSAMGGELDSLASLAGLGMAPLLFAYERSLRFLGPAGLLAACAAAAACAIRLSKNNEARPEGRELAGLPLPVFGLGLGLATHLSLAPAPLLGLLLGLALLMLLDWGYLRTPARRRILLALFLFLGFSAATLADPALRLLLGMGLLYALAGHLPALKRLRLLKPAFAGQDAA